jgi:putative SOS response-associated peptidase YedK
MCGRFAASAGVDEYVEVFGVDEVVDSPAPSFNFAPTDPIPAIVERVDRESGATVRKLVTPRWGLVPSWSKDAAGAARMINARVETVASKPAFRSAFGARRCLIPADGYYEWVTRPATGLGGKAVKQPFFLRPADGGLLVMAGLYEFWRTPAGEWLTTATIITATATATSTTGCPWSSGRTPGRPGWIRT